MSIHKYLDLSTSHLTKAEAQALDACDDTMCCGSRIINHTYGMWVHVPEADADLDIERATYYPRLAQIIAYARHNTIMWVNFDSDGDVDENFPVCDW